MAQAKVTEFYVQRRSSRRTESRMMKRRKLSSSSDGSMKELPFKKPRHELQTVFQEIEDNCKDINLGKSISYHDFTKALKSHDHLQGTTTDGKRESTSRTRERKTSKPKVATSGRSTLEQYLEKKQVKEVSTESQGGAKTGRDVCKTLQEKTPTKRSNDQTEVPIRRKKAKEISSEESGYSSQSSLSDNQSREKCKRQAKRCLKNQFQNVQESSQDIMRMSSQSTVSETEKSKNVKLVKTNPQKVDRNNIQSNKEVMAESRTPNNKSPLKDRIRQTLADQITKKSELDIKGQKKGPRKLTPEEVKAKLAKCGKLEELQAVLGRVKRSTEVKKEVKKAQEKKAEELPAYQKYRHLAVAAPPSLLLPFKYKALEEMFQSTDTVVSMLHNRSEGCSFSKLKAGVQELCRKNFQAKNLGQIKTIFPASYRLYQQKCIKPISKRENNGNGGYELMVEANLSQFNSESLPSTSGTSSSPTMKDIHSQKSFLSKFTPSALITRRTIFHSNLVEMVKEQHKEFLKKQNPPLAVPDDKITRWHPKFPLEQVDDIEPSPLPEPPHVQTYSTAKDVLNKARDLMNPKVAKALELIANKHEGSQSTPEVKTTPQKETDASNVRKAPSGISSDLVERIRAKEARNLQAAMMRSDVDEERIGMLERLPELCMIVRGVFLAERKAALTVDVVIQKLSDSCNTSLSQGQLEKHIELMKEILPDWMKSLKIRKETYLKIDKRKELKDLTNQITKILKEEKRK